MIFVEMIFSILLLLIAAINLSGLKRNGWFFLKWAIPISLIAIMVRIHFEAFAGVVAVILIVVLLIKLNIPPIASIIYAIISMVVGVIGDSIVGTLIYKNYIYQDNARMLLKTNPLLYINIFIFMFLFINIFSKLMGNMIDKRFNRHQLFLKGKWNWLIVSILMVVFVLLYTSMFTTGDSSESSVKILGVFIFYFLVIMMVAYFLVSIHKEEMKKSKKQIELEQLSQYTNNFEIIYNDMRKIRYDYIHAFTSMIDYMDNNDMQGLVSHFNSKIIPYSYRLTKNDFRLDHLSYIKQNEVKGIVLLKMVQAQELGITVSIDIAEEIKVFEMDIIDACKVIGILLDNAIEASQECEEPELKVVFIHKEDSETIIIINSYHKGIPPIFRMYKKGFSTKGKEHGFGLSNLTEITKTYDNVTLDTIIENNEFKQILEIRDQYSVS